MSGSGLLTLIIPTRNRWQYLSRLLRYYAANPPNCHVMIGDSSDPSENELALKSISAVADRLDVDRRLFPDKSAFLTAYEMLSGVKTPYVAIVADDDFLTPAGLDRAVAFLESHPDYVAAHGHAVLFSIESDLPQGRVLSLGPYRQRAIEDSTASQRLLNHLESYSPTIFSVHRTQALLKAYRFTVDLQMDNSFGEYLPSSLPIVSGKTKKIDVLYMARQTHLAMNSRAAASIFDWIATPTWPEQWARFRDCLAEDIAHFDGVTLDEARDTVKEAMWSILAKGLSRKWQRHYGRERSGARLRRWVGRYPEFVAIWQKARSVVPGDANEFLLPSLLRKSSPYHADFMQVYNIISSV